MEKRTKVAVQRLDGRGDLPVGIGNDRLFTLTGGPKAGLYIEDLFPHEKKMVIGLKPGRKRTVHLVMTWEDE